MQQEKKSVKNEQQYAYLILATLAHTDAMFASFAKHFPMTQELFEHCLRICAVHGNISQFNLLWDQYPVFAEVLSKKQDAYFL